MALMKEYEILINRIKLNIERVSLFEDSEDLVQILEDRANLARKAEDGQTWLWNADLADHIENLYLGYKELSEDVSIILKETLNDDL